MFDILMVWRKLRFVIVFYKGWSEKTLIKVTFKPGTKVES